MDELSRSITLLEHRKNQLTKELEDIELELKTQRAEHSRLRNEAVPINRLPNELLTGIFIACQQAEWVSKAPVICPINISVAQVSHRWRRIVLSTSLLWNTIHLRIYPPNHVQGRALARLEAHLSRSDTCFLDIVLNFYIPDGLLAYLKLLSSRSMYWRRLSIMTSYEQSDDISAFMHTANAPILEHLSLSLGKPQDGNLSPRKQYSAVTPSVLTSASPPLSFLRLAGLALGKLHPPSSSVTTLHLDGWTRNYMTHEQFRTILEGTPTLINLSLNQLVIHHPRDPSEMPRPAQLANLQCLRIRGPCSSLYRLTSLMRMPQLESISLQGVDTFDSDVFPNVKSLSLDACAFDEPEISNLIHAFPSVTYLTVDESMPDIFYMLIPDITEHAAPNPWPQLQTISVRELQKQDVVQFCALIYSRQENDRGISKVCLDKRSRTTLRIKERLHWLQDRVQVGHCDVMDPWPAGLDYEDVHDLLE